MPTEAEWEFTCRAGNEACFWTGSEEESIARGAWFASNSSSRTHEVGTREANAFGIHDSLGNVKEWVQDSWDGIFLRRHLDKCLIDPAIVGGKGRVVRGGHIFDSATLCRSATRQYGDPTYRGPDILGFRIVVSVDAVRAMNAAHSGLP